MPEWINNPWVIGIGAPILSAPVVWFITVRILSRNTDKQLIQNIQLANAEVIYALRPGISENVIPNAEVVEHLIQATARKYSIDAAQMYSVSNIVSELIKQVMDSSFISAETKEAYCEKLSELKPKTVTKAGDSGDSRSEHATTRLTTSFATASALTGMAAVMTALVAFLSASDGVEKIAAESQKLLALISPALAAIFVALGATVFSRVWRDIELKKRRRITVKAMDSVLGAALPGFSRDVVRDIVEEVKKEKGGKKESADS